MTRLAVILALALTPSVVAVALVWLNRCPDLSDHHTHKRCAICEWDRIERRLG